MKHPGNGVEKSDQTGFTDTTTEEGIGCKGTEGIVANLGIGWRGATVDEAKIVVCRKDGCVEKNKPDIDAEWGLSKGIAVSQGGCRHSNSGTI